jgi:hypothetical protein
VRTRLAQEVARLERRRAFAHRRMNLVRTLAAAAATAESEEEAAVVQRATVRRELGWERENDFRRAVLHRLQPVGSAIWHCARGKEGAQTVRRPPSSITSKPWFEAAQGSVLRAVRPGAPRSALSRPERTDFDLWLQIRCVSTASSRCWSY